MNAFLTVNEHRIGLQQALNWQILFGGENLIDFVIDLVVSADEAKSRGFEASQDEVQTLFNEIRYMKRLETAESLRAWISDNHVDTDAIKLGCAFAVLRRKLRDSISPEEIAGFYAEFKTSYERAEIYQICIDDPDLANEICAQIVEDGKSFYLMALQHSTDVKTAKMGGYSGVISRSDMAGELEIAVFSAQQGDIIGPIKTAAGWRILMVHELWSVTLREASEAIQTALFAEIVNRSRKRVKVTHSYVNRTP